MKKVVILSLSLLAVALAGCKKGGNDNQGSLNLVVRGDIADAKLVQQSNSRAIASKSSFVANDQIGIFVVPYKTATDKGTFYGSGNYADNVAFTTLDGSAFSPSTAISFPNETTPIDIYAFGMYNTQYNTLGDDETTSPAALPWTVDAAQTSAELIVKNDVMTAAASGVTPQATAIPLVFKHRLAKVELSFTLPTTFRGYDVLGATLNVEGTKLATVLDMTNPATAPSAASGSVTPIAAFRAIPATEATGVVAYTFEAIVVPQTVSAGSTIATVVLNVQTIGTQSLNCQSGGNIEYTTGTNTKLELTFTPEETVHLGAVTITAWNPVDGGSVDARLPNKMIFSTEGASADIDLIKYAELTIDGIKYTADVVRNATTSNLECTYLCPKTIFGEKLSLVTLLKADKTTAVPVTSFTPSFNPTPINIPGDPTKYNYSRVISKATFN